MATTFPILQRDLLLRQTAAVSSTFGAKRSDVQNDLQQLIAEPLATAAASTSTSAPKVLAQAHDLRAIQSGNQVFLVEEKWHGSRVELRCFPPIPAKNFDKKKIDDLVKRGDAADVYGKKYDDIPSIVLEGSGKNVDVKMNGKRQPSLDGSDWARALSESTLALLARGKNAADISEAAKSQSASSSSSSPKSTLSKLTSSTPKPVAGPPLGHDLEGAGTWRGQPVVVTSDRDAIISGGGLHVMIETRAKDGSSVWLPIALPTDSHAGAMSAAKFPRRGCAVLIDGDTLQLVGGLDAKGTPTTARFSVDLKLATQPNFTGAGWVEKAPLKDAAAWAAACVSASDAFVVGGVASYYLKKNSAGDDVKQPTVSRALQVGGYPQWRDRGSAPSIPVGAHAFVVDSVVFVGPGATCDGSLSVFDGNRGAWTSLPNLPKSVGLGQLLKSGDDLVYAGGFDDKGAPSKTVYALNLNDPLSGWIDKGESDAVAGKARVVERDGKLVSLMVAPKGALMVHLE